MIKILSFLALINCTPPLITSYYQTLPREVFLRHITTKMVRITPPILKRFLQTFSKEEGTSFIAQ